MATQFEVEYGTRTASQQTHDFFPNLDQDSSAQGWQFANHFQRVMGEDSEPDSLFFVETWTLGAEAAAENLRQRRIRENDRQSQSRWSGQFDYFGNASVVQDLLRPAAAYSSSRFVEERASMLDGVPAWQQASAAGTSQEFAAHRDLNQPTGLPQTEPVAEPLTAVDAFNVLGVPASSTRSQIKAAFRHLVSKWHPDRFETRNENERHLATEKMAAINKAYQLLRSVA